MKEIYKSVALELGVGVTIWSASNFRNKIMALAAPVSDARATYPVTDPAAPPPTAPVPAVQTVAETETKDMDDLPELKARWDETKQPDIDVMTWTSLALVVQFLGDHWDTHVLSTTFFSFSSTDSFVYYKLQNKVVTKLHIPAGFSIVVTTEIHSGLLSLNPYRVKHYSESADDRLLFRIVHEVPPTSLARRGRQTRFYFHY
jgi:hypothetical protein